MCIPSFVDFVDFSEEFIHVDESFFLTSLLVVMLVTVPTMHFKFLC